VAFTEIGGVRYVMQRARLGGNFGVHRLPVGLAVVDNRIIGVCGDGGVLAISSLTADGIGITAEQLRSFLAAAT
jgi:methionyl-tRNA formyltransferase